jgi:hypothetical protein
MKKLIFGEPICTQIECCHNDPAFPNNCRIISSVEACCMAEVQHPRCIQRILAWLDKYSLQIAVILALCALLIILGIMPWIASASAHNRAIEAERQASFAQFKSEQSTTAAKRAWKRLWRKHGRPGAVVYEPGKTPYYTNKEGRKCRFV